MLPDNHGKKENTSFIWLGTLLLIKRKVKENIFSLNVWNATLVGLSTQL